MSPMPGHTLYDILEVRQDATLPQIERAYRIALHTYSPGSAATYSLLAEDEAAEILRRVEEAYTVLSDARTRREYDTRLGLSAPPPASRPPEAFAPEPLAPEAPPAAERYAVEEDFAPEPPKEPLPVARESFALGSGGDPLEPLSASEPEDGVFDGPVLRRIRLSHGIEIEEIAAVTKINPSHIEAIESNRYVDLPRPVYLRGFLKEYARQLRLDPLRVADSYTARMSERAGGRR
jgi:flagellar biosynthesis protein FlhG